MDQLNSMFSRAKYTHKDKAIRDARLVIQKFKDLRPLIDTYVFDDGSMRELVCLDGTIPVTYKSNTYNIPLQFWLTSNFPHEKPLVFVRPTAQMTINPSSYVDSSGTVKLPYLDDWSFERSDLISLIQILQLMFAEKSPVYSKAISNTVNASSQPSNINQPAAGNMASTATQPAAQSGASYAQPISSAYPPAPGVGVPPYVSQPAQGNYWMPYWQNSVPPASQAQSAAGYPQLPSMPASGSTSGGAQIQPPQPSYLIPPPYANLPASTSTATSASATSATTSASSSNNVYSVVSKPTPAAKPNASELTRTGTVKIEHFKASLVSAIVDKMNRKLLDRISQVTDEVQSLHASQSDLEQGRAELDGIIGNLNREADRLTDSLSQLRLKTKQLEEIGDRLKANEQISADDILVPTAPLYKQLLESYAEEQAYEDAIYCLGDALHREVIDLDVYIKQIRQLARKQFYARLIVRKCREKAGLPVA